jgi:anti-sigma regulatory factor (Ser/Thr protein kinase)
MKSSTVPATLDSLRPIADYVMAAAAAAGLDRRASYRLRLAVDEIATNIIVHGYANAGRQGVLGLRADIDDRALTIAIDDTGVTYDPRQAPIPDINLPIEQRPVGGLGVYLAMRSVDEFFYEQLGDRNRTIFKMHLPSNSLEEDKA